MSIRTLRLYEDRGLLHDRLHLKMILKGRSLGFTLSEITNILASQGEASGKMDIEMGLLPEQIIAQIDHLERQRSQIDEAIKTLRKAHMLELPPRGDFDLTHDLLRKVDHALNKVVEDTERACAGVGLRLEIGLSYRPDRSGPA